MSVVWEGYRLRPRSLMGATVLQIISDLREGPAARNALATVAALSQAGARTLVAAEAGPLLAPLRARGAEWIAFACPVRNPLRLRRAVQAIEHIATAERIDIVHAVGVGAAWCARLAAARTPMRVVTTLPDALPRASTVAQIFEGARARGDSVLASSEFVATAWARQFRIPAQRLAIIPEAVDTAALAPSKVSGERIAAARRSWAVGAQDRVLLVPGAIVPEGGQILLVDVAHQLSAAGVRHVCFVLAGDRRNARYVEDLINRARLRGVEPLFRLVNRPVDLAAALAAAYAVVIPAQETPVRGGIAAQAQAMARPVITTDRGVLPEQVLAPPRIADDLRTGWVVPSRDAALLAQALHQALMLDRMRYQAMAARARQFAEYMFAPARVAAALRGVYTSLLARDD